MSDSLTVNVGKDVVSEADLDIMEKNARKQARIQASKDLKQRLKGILIWDSASKGTYKKKEHGLIGSALETN